VIVQRKEQQVHITCFNCKQNWDIPAGTLILVQLRFGLGADEFKITCPNCGAENVLSKDKYKAADSQIPVPANRTDGEMPTLPHPRRADNDPASAPTNPVSVPEATPDQIHAIVLDKGLRLLRDHNPTSVEMGRIHKGEHVIILNTWTNGDEVWVQLGPERWALVEENGEPLIRLLND
jgi:hypothetical protein